MGWISLKRCAQDVYKRQGLEVLAPLIVEHKGIKLKEFDLDAAMIRHPSLILVDELAHTNAEGCRHKKRYQDIEELLNAGIDVYTTVNVPVSYTHLDVYKRQALTRADKRPAQGKAGI